MPIFGHTEWNNTNPFNVENRVVGSLFQMGPNSGTADSITVNLACANVDGWFKMGIYDENKDFVAETEEKLIPNEGYIYNSQTFNFEDPKPTLVGGAYYYLVAFCEYIALGSGLVGVDAGDGTVYRQTNVPYPDFSDPYEPNSTWPNNIADIYCTYTETAVEGHAVIEDVYTTPPHPIPPGTTFSLHYTIRNDGGDDTIWWDLYKEGTLVQEGSAYLNTGETYSEVYNDVITQATPYTIEAGHIENGTKIRDDTLDYVVYTTVLCEDYTNKTDCEDNGCFWYATAAYPDGHCWENRLTDCGYIRQEDCENPNNGNCFWYNGSCHVDPPPSGYENFLTYEIKDCTPSCLKVETSKITVTNLWLDAEAYVRRDFGSPVIDDFEYMVDLKATSFGGDICMGGLVCLTEFAQSNTIQRMRDNGDGIGIQVWQSGGIYALGIWDYMNESYEWMAISPDFDYYLTLIRTGSYLYLDVYSDPERLNRIRRLTKTLSSYRSYQYLYAQISRGYYSPSMAISYIVSNLDLTPPTCEEYGDETTCKSHGCYWYATSEYPNGHCWDNLDCDIITSRADCEGYDCFWYNGACHSSIICEAILDEAECIAHGCFYWNGSCHSEGPPCSYWGLQGECEANDCYWYNNTCNEGPPICESISEEDCKNPNNSCYWYNNGCHTVLNCDIIDNQIDCESNGCYWYDGSCHPYAPCEDLDETECEGADCYWYATSEYPNGHCWNTLNCDIITDQEDCEHHECIWHNNACHTALECEDFHTEIECWANHCFWYNNSCHSTQKKEIPWLPITIAASAAAIVALAIAIRKRIKK